MPLGADAGVGMIAGKRNLRLCSQADVPYVGSRRGGNDEYASNSASRSNVVNLSCSVWFQVQKLHFLGTIYETSTDDGKFCETLRTPRESVQAFKYSSSIGQVFRCAALLYDTVRLKLWSQALAAPSSTCWTRTSSASSGPCATSVTACLSVSATHRRAVTVTVRRVSVTAGGGCHGHWQAGCHKTVTVTRLGESSSMAQGACTLSHHGGITTLPPSHAHSARSPQAAARPVARRQPVSHWQAGSDSDQQVEDSSGALRPSWRIGRRRRCDQVALQASYLEWPSHRRQQPSQLLP